MLGNFDFEKFGFFPMCWGVLTLINLTFSNVLWSFDFDKFDFFPVVGDIDFEKLDFFSCGGEF